MNRLLFVDDDQQVLDGLRNLLRPQRKRWEMAFARGGEAALVELATGPYDVVVSDMRMPGMDGAALLNEVAKRYPRTVRMVLSGQTEMDTALKSVSFAHQFLSKPCDAEVLTNVLARACDLSAMLDDENLRQQIASIKRLPTTPQVFNQLTVALANPNASLKQVAELLARDVAICARVLQLVNSPFFGLQRRVTSVLEAVTYLGTTTIKSVVLSVESFQLTSEAPPCPGFSFEPLQRHSLFVGSLAKQIVGDKAKAEHAFMAGLLHDIGVLILATHFPAALARMVGDPAWAHEEPDAGPVAHTRLGAYLLGLWGLPYPVIEAVAHHHAPMRVEHRALDIPDAVYVADRLARTVFPAGDYGAEEPSDLDRAYLAGLGVDDAKLEGWRAQAAKLAQDGVPGV